MAGRRRGARSGRGWDAAPPGSAGSPPSRGRPGAAADGRQGERPARPERDPLERAREICLRQLAVRPRTRAELAAALRRHDIPDEVASEVLDRYQDVGMIDDALFAKAWVTSRHEGRGLARRALAGELRRRGVDGDLVSEALEEIDPETERETARALVDRRLRTMASTPPEAVFRRLVGALARKGYPAGLAVAVVKQALAEHDSDLSEFADRIDAEAMADLMGDSAESAG
jgi:regulatory protein